MLFKPESVRVKAIVGHQDCPEVEARSPHCHVEGAAPGVGLAAGRTTGVADDVDKGFANDRQDTVPRGEAGRWGGVGDAHQRPG